MSEDTLRPLSQRGESIGVDEDRHDEVKAHSAFANYGLSDEPENIDPLRIIRVSGDLTPVDRSRTEDLLRAEDEALMALSGAVDSGCLEVLLREVKAEDVEARQLRKWLLDAVQDVNERGRILCDTHVLMDLDLRRYAQYDNERQVVDGVWCEGRVRLLKRADSDVYYAVVADEHLIAMTGWLQASLISVVMGQTEYLTGSASFCYEPRLSLHPHSIKIARVAL